MRIHKAFDQRNRNQGSIRDLKRQFAPVLAFLALVGCSSDDDANLGRIGFVEGFLGGVVADEPRAALVGRDILSAGGTAADAATAVYFTLAVTLPSSASLGGGGVCIVHDHGTNTTEALDFLAQRPDSVPPTASRPSAVPGNARGFFALHSKYGRLRWAQLVVPAENMARFGTQVSRAFARDLSKVDQALMADPASRRIFSRPAGGGTVGEGDQLRQLDLAGVLSRLRSLGPGELYTGQTARALVAGAAVAGGTLTQEDLRKFAPVWRSTVKVAFGNNTAHFAPAAAAAGAVAGAMWAMLTRSDDYADADDEDRGHLFAEMALRAFADRARWLGRGGDSIVATHDLASEARLGPLAASYRPDRHVPAEELDPAPVPSPENPAATSFVVADREGSAVACGLTMNNLFGTGRIAPGTGILLAMKPGEMGRGPISLGPMAVVNHHVNEFFFAAAAAGGVAAPTSMVRVALDSLVREKSLADAMDAPRLHHGGHPDLVYYEPDYDRRALQSLTRRGHRIGATPTLGRVVAILCSGGLPPRPETCQVRADPRGFGLATSANQ